MWSHVVLVTSVLSSKSNRIYSFEAASRVIRKLIESQYCSRELVEVSSESVEVSRESIEVSRMSIEVFGTRYGNLWQLLITFGNFGQLLPTCGHLWQL